MSESNKHRDGGRRYGVGTQNPTAFAHPAQNSGKSGGSGAQLAESAMLAEKT